MRITALSVALGALLLVAGSTTLLCRPAEASSADCPYGDGVYTTSYVEGEWRIINVSGCPEYSPWNQTTPTDPFYVWGSWKVRAQPKMSKQPTWFNNASSPLYQQGQIGIAINGIVVLDAYDGEGRNAVEYEGPTMDSCWGHVNPDAGYHYHTGSTCEVSNVSTGGASPMFAIMADGIPLYGPYGKDGKVPTDLDQCWGHASDGEAFYHYHLPTSYQGTWPYTVPCLAGCIDHNTLMDTAVLPTSCDEAEVQYDYTGMVIPWKANAPGLSSPPPSNSPPPPFPGTYPPRPQTAGSGYPSPGADGGADGDGHAHPPAGKGHHHHHHQHHHHGGTKMPPRPSAHHRGGGVDTPPGSRKMMKM